MQFPRRALASALRRARVTVMRVTGHWRLNGKHHQRTAECWRNNMDVQRRKVMALFERVCGPSEASKWRVRWRVYFMAGAELWGYRAGTNWLVSHYVLEPVCQECKRRRVTRGKHAKMLLRS